MKKVYQVTLVTLVSLSAALCSMRSQAQQDFDPPSEGVATKAAEKIDEVGRALKRGFLGAEESVRGTMREGFARTRDTVQSMGIPSRVYGRLHWDKQLNGASLFVRADGSTVTVRGTLPDAAAKAKAIELVKDTVGVARVIDQIQVLATSTTIIEPAAKP